MNNLVAIVGKEELEPLFQCKLCVYSSTSVNKLCRHFAQTHAATGPVTCHFCGKTLKNFRVLKCHINQQHLTKDGHTKCQKCHKDIPNEKFSNHECETFSCEKFLFII